MVSQVYLLPLLRQVSVALQPLSASVSQSPSTLSVQAFAGESGRVALKRGASWKRQCLNQTLRQVRYKGTKNGFRGGPQTGGPHDELEILLQYSLQQLPDGWDYIYHQGSSSKATIEFQSRN